MSWKGKNNSPINRREFKMLVELLEALTDVYFERAFSSYIYSGYGYTVDRMLEESGIDNSMFRKLDKLAHDRVCNFYADLSAASFVVTIRHKT